MSRSGAAILAALACIGTAAASNLDNWSNLYTSVRSRAIVAGVTPSNVVQPFIIDLGWTNPVVQCVTNIQHGVMNLVCWTNWQRAQTNVWATNFVGSFQTRTQRIDAISAEGIATIDRQVKQLIEDGRFVDEVAVRAAGGVASYLTSYTTTNWYWLPDRTGSNLQWCAVVASPTSFPVLTISQAWARAGLPVVTNFTVATNVATNVVYGWQIGQLTNYTASQILTGPRTNKTFTYHFTAEPAREPFRHLLARASVAVENQWWEDPPLTGFVWSVEGWTLSTNMVPATGFGCRVFWTPPWTNAPTNLLAASASFWVTGTAWIVDATTGLRSVVTGETFALDVSAPATLALSRVYSRVDAVSGPTNGWPTNVMGSALSIVITNQSTRLVMPALAAHGDFWSNLLERVRVVTQLNWTVAAETAGVWHGLISPASATNNDAIWTNRADWSFRPVEVGWTNAGLTGILGMSGFDHIELLYQGPDAGPQLTIDQGDYYQLSDITWPTSRVHSVPFPAAASNFVMAGSYVGQWADGFQAPTSHDASIDWSWPRTTSVIPSPLPPYLVCPTGNLFDVDTFDFVQDTVTVTWATDALGASTNRLAVWQTVTKATGVVAITGVTISVVSGSPADTANVETPAEHRHDWSGAWTNGFGDPVAFTGYYSLRTRFVRPTQRTWQNGQWLFEWTLPAPAVTPP